MNDNNERSGIVTILGEVNVGKSSLLNVLVKKDISIITHKSNTTNKQIKGIRTHKKSQITFIDTPGLYFSKGKTNRNFLTDIWNAVSEADFLCVVLDISKNVSKNLFQFFEQIDFKNLPNKKSILVLNKIDLVEKEKLLIRAKEINDKLQFDKTFMISAKKKYGVDDLFLWLSKNITKKKWLYPSDKKIINRPFFLILFFTNLNISEKFFLSSGRSSMIGNFLLLSQYLIAPQIKPVFLPNVCEIIILS